MKTWIAPQLVVLKAGKPEEAVLHVCKSGLNFNGTTTSGPQSTHMLCAYVTVTGGLCSACAASVLS